MSKLKICLLFSALCLLPVSGCAELQKDPRAELLAHQKAFTSVVESLTTLQRAGKFSPTETQHLTLLIHQGREYLTQWQAALEAGRPRPDLIEAFDVVLEALIEANLQKGGD